MVLYHYCAVRVWSVGTQTSSGCIEATRRMQSKDEYEALRDDIIAQAWPGAPLCEVSITSLSIIGGDQ